MNRVRSVVAVYWPVMMMGSTVILASLLDHSDTTGLSLAFRSQPALAMLLSPYFLLCVALMVAGLVKANRVWAADERGFSTLDKMATVWFLTNAIWYHLGCDIMSGLLQIMPTMRDFYVSSNAVHAHTMHHPDRAFVDAVYYLELLLELPLCVLTYSLYLKRSSIRPVVEAFVCALHIAGTFAFYLPGLLTGETTHPILSNLDRSIGMLWLVFPAFLTVRAVRQVREAVKGAPPEVASAPGAKAGVTAAAASAAIH